MGAYVYYKAPHHSIIGSNGVEVGENPHEDGLIRDVDPSREELGVVLMKPMQYAGAEENFAMLKRNKQLIESRIEEKMKQPTIHNLNPEDQFRYSEFRRRVNDQMKEEFGHLLQWYDRFAEDCRRAVFLVQKGRYNPGDTIHNITPDIERIKIPTSFFPEKMSHYFLETHFNELQKEKGNGQH